MRLQGRLCKTGVGLLVRLGARGLHGRAAAGVQKPELDHGCVDQPGHGTAQGVDLANEIALGDTDRQTLESDLKTKFGIVTHTVTATAGTGGTISPTGGVIVTHGTNQSFTIAPSTGYNLTDVQVDGVSVGAVTSYAFTNVTADHTIAASFTMQTRTITASAGFNGSVSPSGATTVNYGASQGFTITPSSGYVIQDVLADGVSQGRVASYTFTNVTANHTLAASFMTLNLYAYGTTSTGAILNSDNTFNQLSQTPMVQTNNSSPSGVVSFVYSRRKSGATYTVQFGSDLNTWYNSDDSRLIYAPGQTANQATVISTVTNPLGDHVDYDAVSIPFPLFIKVGNQYIRTSTGFARVQAAAN